MEITKLLIAKGAYVKAEDNDAKTVFDYAKSSGAPEAIISLLESKLNAE